MRRRSAGAESGRRPLAAGHGPPSLAPTPSAKAEPPAAPAPPARKPTNAVPTAKVSPQSQLSAPQTPVKVATAAPVSPATVPKKQSPPPLAVPIAVPNAGPIPAASDVPVAIPVASEPERTPLDDIAAMLDFEKSVPRAPSSSPVDVNPYASPAAESRRATARHASLSVSAILRDSWSAYKANLGLCVGTFLVAILGYFGATVAIVIAIQVYGSLTRGTVLVFGIVAFWPLLIGIPAWFMAGLSVFGLNVARGEKAEMSNLFDGRPYVLPMLAMMLLQLVFVGIATALTLWLNLQWLSPVALLPLVLFVQTPFVAVHQELGAIGSIAESIRLTIRNILPLCLIWATMFVIYCGTVVPTCGLGAIVVGPFLLVMNAVTYLAMAKASRA